mgnify:CR=1 FL=1
MEIAKAYGMLDQSSRTTATVKGYYFIDPDTGDEIDCDHLGNPLED